MKKKEIGEGTEVIVHTQDRFHLNGARGVVVKVLDPPVVEKLHEYHYFLPEAIRPDGTIENRFIVDFPDAKLYMFDATRLDRSVPDEEKKWVQFPKESVTIAPKLSDFVLAEKVGEKTGGHATTLLLPMKSGKCIVKGCNSVAIQFAGRNVQGRGYVFKACELHAKELGNKWSDSLGFKPKHGKTVTEAELKVTPR